MLRCLDCGQADIDKHGKCATCGSPAISEVHMKREPNLVREFYNAPHAKAWQRFRDFFKTTNQWGIPINTNKESNNEKQ